MLQIFLRKFWDDKSQEEKGEIVFALPGFLLASGIGIVLIVAYLTGN